jgi:hypothetical protein
MSAKSIERMQIEGAAFAVRGSVAFVVTPMFCIKQTGEKSWKFVQKADKLGRISRPTFQTTRFPIDQQANYGWCDWRRSWPWLGSLAPQSMHMFRGTRFLRRFNLVQDVLPGVHRMCRNGFWVWKRLGTKTNAPVIQKLPFGFSLRPLEAKCARQQACIGNEFPQTALVEPNDATQYGNCAWQNFEQT